MVAAAIPETARDTPIELWWQDEARVGQQGTLTRCWARKGTRPRRCKDTRYKWAYIFGAALVLPTANADMMTRHLAELSANVQPGHHAVVILDGAGWHKTGGRLTVPDNISLLLLPPYAPELNPVENVWQYLRQNFLAHRVFEGYDQIVDACCDAWNRFVNNPKIVQSITSRHWAKVNV